MKNALLCFLKYPEPGHVKTRLAADLTAQGAADLYSALAERVLTEVYPLDNDYDLILCVDPAHDITHYQKWIGDSWQFREQQGADLGERMSHSIRKTFDEGYEKVAIIGTDCIGMDGQFIEHTFKMLDNHDFVIGPSSDGGYYLLALKAVQDWLFERMAWSTEEVLETTLDRIEARDLKVAKLAEKIDIDTVDDLIVFRKSLPAEHFLAKKIDQIVLGQHEHSIQELPGEQYLTYVIDGVHFQD